MWINVQEELIKQVLYDAEWSSAANELADLVTQFSRTEEDEAYVAAAKAQQRDGELEVDENTVVSSGEDGAYVMAWMFVSNEEAGVQAAAAEEASELGKGGEWNG